jgi:ABC-type antimicrobial peptide transport system permease subunit
MIKNYFRVAFRNLAKNKSYVVINTLGLGISLACCIAAYILVAFNIEFDDFHDNGKVANIFAFHTLSTQKDGKPARDIQAPFVLPPIAAEEISGIKRFTRFVGEGGALRYKDQAFNEYIHFADSTFFDLFDFPLASGSHQSFKEKNTIFLTQEMAKKYFGDEDPVGKIMVANFVNEKEIALVVGGVFEKIPMNNSFYFSMIMRFENFVDIHNLKLDDWSDWRNPSTYFELASPENAAAVSQQFRKYIPTRNKVRTDIVVDAYELVPFKSGFNQEDIRWTWAIVRISYVPLIIFTSMALLILLIACFNLTNTSIAMTGKRLKEVGIRKAVGAAREQIVLQFLFETLLTIVMALVVGLLMAQVIVPAFVDMWRLPYGLEDMDGVNLFIALIFLVFLASLLAGIYPALFSSKIKPTQLLKGGVKVSGTNALTQTLVALQFALSVIVLIAGVVFIQNTRYQEEIKFGYEKEKLITVRLQGERDFLVLEKELAENPKILSVAVSDGNLGGNNYQTPVTVDTSRYDVQAMGVGKNYMETVGLKVLEGRTFNLDNASDQEDGIIVNREFLARTGLTDPIEKTIILHDHKRVILGVVENHIDNVFRASGAEPFVFYPAGKNQYVTLIVKAEKADIAETQKYLETTWKRVFPTKPFESQLQEDVVLKGSKETNANLEKIFLFITVLGGLLSASGIFALASLNVAKRTKEIGIRKALGASVPNIVALLNREFVIILVSAGAIGAVAGFYLTEAILAQIYKLYVEIGIVTIVLCALLILLIGLLTTSTTIFSAAKANPVDTLRSE